MSSHWRPELKYFTRRTDRSTVQHRFRPKKRVKNSILHGSADSGIDPHET